MSFTTAPVGSASRSCSILFLINSCTSKAISYVVAAQPVVSWCGLALSRRILYLVQACAQSGSTSEPPHYPVRLGKRLTREVIWGVFLPGTPGSLESPGDRLISYDRATVTAQKVTRLHLSISQHSRIGERPGELISGGGRQTVRLGFKEEHCGCDCGLFSRWNLPGN